MKQTCPFCSKTNIDGRHLRACPKRPQDEAGSPLIEEKVETPMPIEIPVKTDKVEVLACPQCGIESIKLNSIDYRCPKCGDHEMKRPLPTGVK